MNRKTRRKNNGKKTIKPSYRPLDKISKRYKNDDKNGIFVFNFVGFQLTNEQKRKTITISTKAALVLGVICLIFFFNMFIMRIFPVQKPKQYVIAKTVKQTPVELIIKNVNIDLPVLPAVYTNGTFETTTKGVSYLTASPLPGVKGNSIMYAHNWWNLFGNLVNVKKGEKIAVLFTDKTKKTFTITLTQTVTAKQISIL